MADDRRTKRRPATSTAKKRGEDVALVFGASEDGDTLGVLRKRGDEVVPALVKKAVEGQPIHGELVRLKPRDEPLLYDVDVVYDPREEEGGDPSGSGPAQVATDAYRKGWDRLFRKPKRIAGAN